MTMAYLVQQVAVAAVAVFAIAAAVFAAVEVVRLFLEDLGGAGKRGKVNVEYWAVIDARGEFVAEGLDKDTALEIADCIAEGR